MVTIIMANFITLMKKYPTKTYEHNGSYKLDESFIQ